MTIPPGLSAESFSKRYEKTLRQKSTATVVELRKTFRGQKLPDSVNSASIEIFLDETGERGPSFWLYFDGPSRRVAKDDSAIFPGRSMELLVFCKTVEGFDKTYLDGEEFSPLQVQGNLLKGWFAEMWWKAGGWDYPLPISISTHDDHGDGDAIALSELADAEPA